jgi:protein-S-isoprenylcysteine O-methyltransferase Ste14
MSLLKILIVVILIACYLSFSWAMSRFFIVPHGKNASPMRILYFLAKITASLQLGTILYFIPVEQFWNLLIGSLLGVISLSLFWWSVQANKKMRLPIAFSKVTPASLNTSGPYHFVRHPFYLSYMLAWIAGPLASGQWWLLISTIVLCFFYWYAASQEEESFIEGALSAEYLLYRSRAGMFIPRFNFRGRLSKNK